MMMRKLIIITILLMAACIPLPDATPTPSSGCYGFTDGMAIVSDNHCLQTPYSADLDNTIIQAVPEGWQVVNILHNADGIEDDQTDYARITSNGFGLTYDLHNGLHGIDGQWGYEQVVTLEPGCYLCKVAGHNNVNDPPNNQNYTAACYFDEGLISQQIIPAQSGFELIYPFQVEVAGDYPLRFMIEVLWGSAGHGSTIDILGAGVLAVDAAFCD